MSAICGLYQRDGEPVAREDIARMMDALARRGPDGSGVWCENAVALGHQMLHITPESLNEKLPSHDALAQLTITADARLDNRAELCDLLDIPHNERASLPDSTLILRAYLKWQERCAERLLGAFAFAIWDARRQRLVCAVDALGEFGIFFWHDARRFIFASEIKSILAAPNVPKQLNARKLAAGAYPFIDADDQKGTLYEDVHRLPAATVLIVTPEKFETFEYWKPDPTRRLPFKRDDEILEGLRETIFAAVRARTRSAFPVAALLSGGLDSSSVVSVASRVLQEAGQQLITLSAVVAEDERAMFPDEREFMDEFRAWSNLERVLITAEGRGPFDEVEKLVRGADSTLHTSRHYLYTAFAEAARARGARVILDGVGGEWGVSGYGEGLLAEWFVRGQWRTLWRELKIQSGGLNKYAWRVFRNQVVPPLVPSFVRRLRGQTLAPQWLQWSEANIFRRDFADAQWKSEMKEWHARAFSFGRTSADHRQNQAGMISYARGGLVVTGHVGDDCARLTLPLFDQRVLEYCLAAPGHLKLNRGRMRYLLRASMEGVLPPAIQWRTSKQPFSPDYAARYNRQRPTIHAWLNEIVPSDPVRAILDVPKLQELAAQDYDVTIHYDTPANYAALHVVPFGVYLIYFLRQFDAFR